MTSTTPDARTARPIARGAVLGAAMGLAHLAPAARMRWAPDLILSEDLVAAAALAITLLALADLLTLACRMTSLGRRLALGLAAALAYHLVAAHWTAQAYLDPGEAFSAEAALGLTGLMLLMVPFLAAALALAPALAGPRPPPWAAALATGCAFTAADLALADLVHGVPLSPLALVLLDTPAAPALGLLGTHGATGLVAAAAAILAATAPGTRLAAVGVLFAAAVLPAAIPLGKVLEERAGPGAPVALVQPGDHAPMEDLVALTRQAFDDGARLVVLPELAVPVDLAARPPDPAAAPLLDAVPPHGVLIAGHLAVALDPDGDGWSAANEAAILGHAGRRLGAVRKAHLVPYGERVPPLLAAMGLRPIVGPPGGYDAAPALKVIDPTALGPLGRDGAPPPFAALICFEALLSGAVARETPGAAWLLALTNERAFGTTLGPALLLRHARLRAAETGLPMLRAAATAHTAVLGPRGAVEAQLPLGAVGVVWADWSEDARPTPFRRLGPAPLHAAWALALTLLLARRLGAVRLAVVVRPARRPAGASPTTPRP